MPSAGSTVTLTSVITPSIPSGSSIQWFKDGKAIRSPSDPRRLVLPAVSSELTGEYTCRVTTGQQCVTSAPVTLAMAAEAPYIVWHTSTK